jgi:hypothetical protein
MPSRAFLFFLLSLLAGLAAAWAQEVSAAAPAKNWKLPLFTKEGFRSMTLLGSEVRPVDAGRIDVTDMNITVFSGDAAAKVDTVILSPAATFLQKENLARGDKSVRLLRDDIEVTGEDWTYDQTARKATIAKKVRVVFRAQLPDILK